MISEKIENEIYDGGFPGEALNPVKKYPIDFIPTDGPDYRDFEKKGREMLRQRPAVFANFLTLGMIFAQIIDDLEVKNRTKEFWKMLPVNALINIGYDADEIPNDKIISKANQMACVFTDIDKALAGIIYLLHEKMMKDENEEDMCYMFAFVRLLNDIEKIENEYKVTVKLTKNTVGDARLNDLLVGDWSDLDLTLVRKLYLGEAYEIGELQKIKKSLQIEMTRSRKEEKAYIKQTEESDSWPVFLGIMNDLAKKEFSTVKMVSANVSEQVKIDYINRYMKEIANFEAGKVSYHNHEYDIRKIYADIKDRPNSAPNHLSFELKDSKVISLSQSASKAYIEMLNDPKTYNYLMLVYQLFQLEPNQANVKNLVGTLEKLLARNFSSKPTEQMFESLDGKIAHCYEMIVQFYSQHKREFDDLKFDRIFSRGETIVSPYKSELLENMESFCERITEWGTDAFQLSEDMDRELFEIYHSDLIEAERMGNNYLAQVKCYLKKHVYFTADNEIFKRFRLMQTMINILADVLRVILRDAEGKFIVNNVSGMKKIRRNLFQLDRNLVLKTYNNTAYNNHEYEETNDYNTSDEYEDVSNRFAYKMINANIKRNIMYLFEEAKTLNLNGILINNSEIRARMNDVPWCEERKDFEEWMDNKNKDIQNLVIEKCIQADPVAFRQTDQDLRKAIGDEYLRVPDEARKCLTVAELLFRKFLKGSFDYSIISSLYYRGVEIAYNKLIWKDYSDYLNRLELEGKTYTEWLSKKASNRPESAGGYMPDESGFVVSEDGKVTAIRSELKMEDFYKLMRDTTDPNADTVDHFRNYLVKKARFKNVSQMMDNKEFNDSVRELARKLSYSRARRDRAAHGSTKLDMREGSKDQRFCLSEQMNTDIEEAGMLQLILKITRKRI